MVLVPSRAVKEGRGGEEQLDPLRVIEIVPKPGKGIQVIRAMLGLGEIGRISRFENQLSGTERNYAEAVARAFTGQQQIAHNADVIRLLFTDQGVEQFFA